MKEGCETSGYFGGRCQGGRRSASGVPGRFAERCMVQLGTAGSIGLCSAFGGKLSQVGASPAGSRVSLGFGSCRTAASRAAAGVMRTPAHNKSLQYVPAASGLHRTRLRRAAELKR